MTTYVMLFITSVLQNDTDNRDKLRLQEAYR